MISRNEEKLLATMADTQKELFTKYADCVREYLVMAECLLFQNSFRLGTALNNGLVSAGISFLRTLVFELGAVLLLPILWEINGIWASIVVAEFMATIVGAVLLICLKRKYNY